MPKRKRGSRNKPASKRLPQDDNMKIGQFFSSVGSKKVGHVVIWAKGMDLWYDFTPTAITGKCTTTFRAESQSSQTARKRRHNVPHDSSDSSDSEADSDLEHKSDDSEGSGHSKSDDNEGSGHSDLDNDLDTVTMDHMASSTSGQPSLHPDVSSGDFGKVVQLKA